MAAAAALTIPALAMAKGSRMFVTMRSSNALTPQVQNQPA